MKKVFEIWGQIPEGLRKQFRYMAWGVFAFVLLIQAVSFFKNGAFYDFELMKLFGL